VFWFTKGLGSGPVTPGPEPGCQRLMPNEYDNDPSAGSPTERLKNSSFKIRYEPPGQKIIQARGFTEDQGTTSAELPGKFLHTS